MRLLNKKNGDILLLKPSDKINQKQVQSTTPGTNKKKHVAIKAKNKKKLC